MRNYNKQKNSLIKEKHEKEKKNCKNFLCKIQTNKQKNISKRDKKKLKKEYIEFNENLMQTQIEMIKHCIEQP